MNAKQLRQNTQLSYQQTTHSKRQIYIILDNVLDTYNVGAIFRLADAVAAKKLFLCGGTETPPNPRIKKASINTSEIVEWQYTESALQTIEQLKKTLPGIKIIAIEQAPNSLPYNKYKYQLPLALVVGNESYGVLPATLKACDGVVELPMFGINISLNVMVSLAVVLYQAVTSQ